MKGARRSSIISCFDACFRQLDMRYYTDMAIVQCAIGGNWFCSSSIYSYCLMVRNADKYKHLSVVD